MNEIKCPNCGTVFTVDESEYASLLEQVRTKEFEKSVEKEIARINTQAKKDAEIAMIKANVDKERALAERDRTIAVLKAELENKEQNSALQIQKAIADKDREIFELKTEMQSNNEKYKSERELLVAQHKKEIDAKDETIGFYKDFKMRMSTKMVGESLEQHCENTFNEVRAMAFPHAQFGKDNDAKSGSKGDYIYREFSEDGTEILSIMFEMKNEMDTTATKHKNEHFFAELDKDRKQKGCEYAILVSMLEPDSELYNKGVELLSEPQTIEYAVNKLVDVQEEQLKNNTTLCALTKEKNKIDKALENIADSIENGMASKTTAKRLKELEEKQEMLEEEIAIAESKQATPLSKSQIKAFYAEALKLETRMLIEYLVQEVIAYDDKIEIIFKSPLNTVPDESQGFLLCEKTPTTNTISLRSEKHKLVEIEIWIG